MSPGAASHRSRLRRLIRILGLLLAVGVGVVVVLLLLLQTPPGRRFVLGRLQQYLGSQHIDLRAASLDYNLFTGSVSADDVVVRGGTLPGAPPIARVGHLDADVSLPSLLGGHLVVQSGTLRHATIRFIVAEDGRSNLPGAGQPSTGGGGSLPLIERFRVSDSQVEYEDHRQDLDVRLPISSIDVTGRRPDEQRVEIDAGGGSIGLRGHDAAIRTIAGTVTFDRTSVQLHGLTADIDGAHLVLSTQAVKFNDPNYDASVTGQLDLASVSKFADLRPPVRGTLHTEVQVRGTATDLRVHARLDGTGLQYRTLDHGQLAATVNYDTGARQAQLASLRLETDAGAVRAEGVLSLDRDAGNSRIQATLDAIDADALTRAFDVPYGAATRIDGRVTAHWPVLEFARASGHASLTLTATRRTAAPGLMPVSGHVDATAEGDLIKATLSHVRAAGATATGEVYVADRQNLDGRIEVRTHDVGRLIASVETMLGRTPEALAGADVSGPASLDARLGGTIGNPVVNTTIQSSGLAAGSVSDIGVSVQAQYTPSAIRIGTADLTWSGGSFHAAGRIGLEGRRALDLSASATDVPIDAALAAAGQREVPASGTASLQATVGGTVARPEGSIHVQGEQLTAYGEPLGTLSADVRLAGRQVDLTDLHLHKPQAGGNGSLTATASYSVDRDQLALRVQSQNLRLGSLTLPGDIPVRGAVQLTADLHGSLHDPTGTATAQIQHLQIRQQPLGDVTLHMTAGDQRAHVQMTAGRFNLTGSADVSTTAPYAGHAQIDLNGLDLAALPLGADVPLTGTLQARATAAGTLSNPAEGSAALQIQRLSAHWYGQPITVNGPATIRYADRALTLQNVTAHARASTATVDGTLPLDGPEAGSVRLDATIDLATLATYAPESTGLSADGMLKLAGTVRGTLQQIEPDLTATISNGMVNAAALDQPVSNISGRLRAADSRLTIESLRAALGPAAFDASGVVPFAWLPADLPVQVPRRAEAGRLDVTLENLDLATVPGTPAALTGAVSAHANLQAPQPSLASVSGRIVFPRLEVAVEGLTLSQQGTSTIRVEDGNVAVQQFTLDGSLGHLALSGTAGLTAARPLNLAAQANLRTAAVSAFTDKVNVAGRTTLQLTAAGTMGSPQLDGYLQIANGRVAMDDPRVAMQDLDLRIDLAPGRLTLSRLNGTLNGGTLSGSGSVALQGVTPTDVNLRIQAKDVAFDQPLDLRSLSDADLRITRDGDDVVVGGRVIVQEAGLTSDLNIETGLFAYLQAPPSLDLTEERSPALEHLRFNVQVKTASPILVDNNLARAQVDANVRVLGTVYDTGMSGRIDLEEGGVVTLNERRYDIRRGVVNFIDDRRIVPSFDLQLGTTARNYDITVQASGTPADTDTTLTSDPALPEPDIMALLVTGRTLDEMRGEEFEVAQTEVLSYLAGRVGTTLGRTLQEATGLSTVRIEPNLIASEADPTARLTLGQDLTDNLSLVYSTDLVDSSDHIWVAEYDVTKRFVTRGVRQSDGSFRFDFRHDLRFGGVPAPRRQQRTQPLIGRISVTGTGPLTEPQVRDAFGLATGDKYDFFKVRDGVARITRLYGRRDRLQARVRVEHATHGDTVDLTLHVVPGPRVQIVLKGTPPPRHFQDDARAIWQRGVFDTQRADDVWAALKAQLVDKDYVAAKVDYAFDRTGQGKRVTFTVDPGPQFKERELVFDGASAISQDELQSIVEQQNLVRAVYTNPSDVTGLLQRVYRERGYLDAAIDPPRYEFDRAARTARTVFPVHEGLRYHIHQVLMSGNHAYTTAALVAAIPSVSGDPYLPATAERSLRTIRQMYWSKGYNDVQPFYRLTLDGRKGLANLVFTIDEGRRSIVDGIDVKGNEETTTHLVRGELQFKPGVPLDLSDVAASRKNLYNTSAFTLVNITRQPEASGAPAGAGAGRGGTAGAADLAGPMAVTSSLTGLGAAAFGEPGPAKPGDVPVRMQVAVREVQPFQVRYGASYDTEGGIGGILDVINHNSLGKAREVGLQTRYDSQIHEARLYFSQPTLQYFPVQTIASAYYRQERNPATSTSKAFNLDRVGVSLEQEAKLANRYVWSYGYRFEQSRNWSPDLVNVAPSFTKVSPLTSTLTRDTRDEALDAVRGSFLSHAFSFSPRWLGGDSGYIKYFGQYFRYIPLQPPRRKPFTGELLRPRFVYAGGIRIGLAHGVNGDLVPLSERFFAGGSTTLRGYAQNALGPIGADGVPDGGDALLVINNEVRFPLVWLFDGAAFVDAGNVYANVSDFSFGNLRTDGGVGLRVRTPWFLVRLDYGIPFNPRAGEPKSRLFFSIGQAF